MSAPTGSTERLNPERVVNAAIALAEEEGLVAVTVRRLTRGLGVTPMAFYWHFRNKDELLDDMADAVLAHVEPSADRAMPWADQLRGLLGSVLGVLHRFPVTASLVTHRTASSEAALDTTEALLDVLRRGGFTAEAATQVARHALATLANLAGGRAGVVVQEPGEPSTERIRARHRLEALPRDRFPRLTEAAAPLTEGVAPDAHLCLGLDLLVAGVVATAPGPITD